MTFEPYVSASEAAKFLSVERRFLLSLARTGIAGAYPLGTGQIRKRWVFRLSELSSAIDPKVHTVLFKRPPERESGYDRSIRRSSLK
jgi:hypothetical protein